MNKLIYLIILIYTACASVYAAKPLYEIGVAGFMGYLPDYPAANQGRYRSLAVPSFAYRGFIFRSDKKGTRARFFKSDKLDFDLSFGASLPANSENNDAREGMDDLDYLLETGPRVSMNLYKTSKHLIEVEFPLRFVISTDFQFTKERGYRFSPQLSYNYQFSETISFDINTRLSYGAEDLNDYIYEVTSEDATKFRQEYNAKAGYIGQSIGTNMLYKENHYAMIIGMRYSNYSKSANENSPLFKSKEDASIYLGFNYFLYQSEELAQN